MVNIHSPRIKVEVATILSQDDKEEKCLLDSRKFNTEAIDEIFEKKNAKRFKCLDEEDGMTLGQFNNSSEDNEQSQKFLKTIS